MTNKRHPVTPELPKVLGICARTVTDIKYIPYGAILWKAMRRGSGDRGSQPQGVSVGGTCGIGGLFVDVKFLSPCRHHPDPFRYQPPSEVSQSHTGLAAQGSHAVCHLLAA